METSLVHLKKLAQGAVGGSWQQRKTGGVFAGNARIAECPPCEGHKGERNRKFIAAADPKQILSMIEYIENKEARIAELEEREQALAAQFISMQDAATDLIHASTEEEAGDAMERIAECSEKQARDLLTCRDLLQRADELETLAGSMPMLSSMGAKEALRLRAAELRKQAEGQQ